MDVKSVEEYRIKHGCSLMEAKIALKRLEFTEKLTNAKSIEEMVDTTIKILDFEFGGYTKDK